jgi:glycosyltransferase involved in cell wall biosynthesis
LAAADVGLAFRATDFSTQAIAPIKLGEYLLCGLPVIGTAHIGDTAPAISGGVFYDASTRSISDAAAWVEDTVLAERERLGTIARMVGLDRFSLRRSVEDYYAAVRSVADREAKRRHAVDHKPSATG